MVGSIHASAGKLSLYGLSFLCEGEMGQHSSEKSSSFRRRIGEDKDEDEDEDEDERRGRG